MDEALAFLQAAKPDPLYPAFVLLLLYGMRRGEVLGLRWQDVDLDAGTLRIRQQIGRVSGELRTGPVKTKAGNRDLPIPSLAHAALWFASNSKPPTVKRSAPAGRTPAWSSPPAAAGRSNPGTLSARSAGSATKTSSA